MKNILFCLLACGFGPAAKAQKAVTGNWFIYYGNQEFAKKKWNFYNEVQVRNYNFAGDLQQVLLRTGIGRNITEDINLLAGYGFVYAENYEAGDTKKSSSREHRIYEQLISKDKWGTGAITHRYRFEQRFIDEDFELRLRYQLSANIPINARELKKNVFYLSVYNEIFVNTAKPLFDRNRLFGGIGFVPAKDLKLELGFMNQTLEDEGRNQFQVVFYNNRSL